MRRRRIGQVAIRGLTVQVGRMARLLGSALIALMIVSVASFWLTNLLPGDPATSLLPPGSPPEATAQLRAELRLDDPVPARFIHWAARVAQGDLGTSYRTGEPVIDVLRRALLVTGELVVAPGASRRGCAVAPRCASAPDLCRAEAPPLIANADDRTHLVACWHPFTVPTGEGPVVPDFSCGVAATFLASRGLSRRRWRLVGTDGFAGFDRSHTIGGRSCPS